MANNRSVLNQASDQGQAQPMQLQPMQAQGFQGQAIQAQLLAAAGLPAAMQHPTTVINVYNINASHSSVSFNTVDASRNSFTRVMTDGSDPMLPSLLTEDDSQFSQSAPTVGQLSPDFKAGTQPGFSAFDGFGQDSSLTPTNKLRESSLVLPQLETADRQSSQTSFAEMPRDYSTATFPSSSPIFQSDSASMMQDTQGTLQKGDQQILSAAIERVMSNPSPMSLNADSLDSPAKFTQQSQSMELPNPNAKKRKLIKRTANLSKRQKTIENPKEQKTERHQTSIQPIQYQDAMQSIHYIQFYSALCTASIKGPKIFEGKSKSKSAKENNPKINRDNFLYHLSTLTEVFQPTDMNGVIYNTWLSMEKNNQNINLLITIDLLKKQMLFFALDEFAGENAIPFLTLSFENEKLIAYLNNSRNTFWQDLKNIEEMTQLIQKFYCADEVLYFNALDNQAIQFNQSYRFTDFIYNNLIKSSCILGHEFRGQYNWKGINLNLVFNRAIPYTSYLVTESKLIELFYNGTKIPTKQKYLSLKLEEEVYEVTSEKKKSAIKIKKSTNTLLEVIFTSDYKVGELHTINTGQQPYKTDFKNGPLSGTEVVSIYNELMKQLPIEKILLVDESKKTFQEDGEPYEVRIPIRLISAIVNGKTFYERQIPGLKVFKCEKLETEHDGKLTQDPMRRTLSLVQLININIQSWFDALKQENHRIKNELEPKVPGLRSKVINEYIRIKEYKTSKGGKKGLNLSNAFDSDEKMEQKFNTKSLESEFPKDWKYLRELYFKYYRTARYIRLNSDNYKKLELLWEKYGMKNSAMTIKNLVEAIYDECKKNKREVTPELVTISKLLCDDLPWNERRNDFYLYREAKDSFVRLKVREILWGGYYWIQDRTTNAVPSHSNNGFNSSNNGSSSNSEQKQLPLTNPKVDVQQAMQLEIKQQPINSQDHKHSPMQVDSGSNSKTAGNANAENLTQSSGLVNGVTPTMFSTQGKSSMQQSHSSLGMQFSTTHMQASTSVAVLGPNALQGTNPVLLAGQQFNNPMSFVNPPSRGGLRLFPPHYVPARSIPLSQAMSQSMKPGSGLFLGRGLTHLNSENTQPNMQQSQPAPMDTSVPKR